MSTPTPPLPDIGWPITLVFATGIVSHTVVVDGLATRKHFLVRTAKIEQDLQLDIADDGITWLRGHHLLDSEPVRAALAGMALGATQESEVAAQLSAQQARFEDAMRKREQQESIRGIGQSPEFIKRWPSGMPKARLR